MTIPRKKKRPPFGVELLNLVEKSLDDDKATDVVVIDLAGKTEIADFMVVATGQSQRQVGAMAEHLRDKIRSKGFGGVSIEGGQQCDWVLIDAGDVVVHLFRQEVRDFYGIEKIWMLPDTDAGGGTGRRASATA